LSQRGFLDRFESPEALRRKVAAALTKTVREHFAKPVDADALADEGSPTPRRRAELLARIEREREMSGFSSSGSPRYSTRERLIVENRGTGAAEDVVVFFEGAGNGERQLPFLDTGDEPVRRLPPGGMLEYPVGSFLGMSPQWDIVFRWRESGAEYEDRQTLR